MSDACDVVLGLSGGVDSSLACAMLLEQGLRPLAVTFRFQPCDDDAAGSCCGAGAVRLAARVAARLGVEHRVVDLRAEFERLVLARAWQQYAAGRTPNPCVDCNRLLRFPALARLADELGAPWLATGHHARLRPGTEGAGLLRGADTGKDQSYFLYGVDPALLARCRFPVGGLHKEEVRRRAAALGLETAGRPDSQDLCLDHQGLGPGELLRLRFRGERRPGEIVDEQGRPLGRHGGVHRFTIGQRRGLELALGRPAWVCALDAGAARVTVTCDPGRLLAGGLVAGRVSWLDGERPRDWFAAAARIRYRHAAVPCRARLEGERLEVRFAEPQRAVTPGQALVLYRDDRVLGGGTIESEVRP